MPISAMTNTDSSSPRKTRRRALTLAVVALALSAIPAAAQRVNFAKYQQATASVHNSTYVADFAVDGIVSNFHTWRTGDNPGPHWLEISYPRPVTLASAHLYSGRHSPTPIQFYQNFKLQHHDGDGWIDIPGASVTGNTNPELNIIFDAPVTSTRFRLQSNENSNRTIRQLAMFPPNPDTEGVEQGFPLGTDVILNLAYKRPASSSSAILSNPSGPGYAKNAFDGYLDDTSRWLCTSAAGEWLEVDLLADHAVGSAHVHSGFIGDSDPRETTQPIENFKLQYFSGGSWLDIPGADITGNTQVARAISFTEAVVTSRVRLVTTTAFSGRIQELLLFPPSDDGGYELGREVIDAPPPADNWATFYDSSYVIRCNISSDYRLAYSNGSVVFASGGSGGRTAQGWQLLRNYRDGSYRIRHNDTGKCLALDEISFADNNLVVLEDYTGMPHQSWFLQRVDATHFLLVNAYSGMALQSRSSTWANGHPMAVRPVNGQGIQQWRAVVPLLHPKKGIAATNNIPNPPFADPAATWMSHFFSLYQNSSWSYSWGRQRSTVFPYMGFDHSFNPMQWGNFNFAHGDNQGPLDTIRNDLQSNARPVSLMGFNEPDGAKQANMAVATAIARWPRLESMEVPLVSPGPVNAPNAWITDFYNQADSLGYRVDYTNMHWYKRPNSATLVNDIINAYNTYGRRVWLTEFSAVRWTGTATWTHADNYHFLAEFLWRAESLPELARYSLFNFRENASGPNQDANDPPEAPRSNSIRSDGTLTPFGELYASWDNVAQIVASKAYHIHNRGQFQRAANPGSGTTPQFTSPDDSGPGTQWFHVAGNAGGTYRMISTRDGRPLIRPSGQAVQLGAVGDTSDAAEWQLVQVNADGNHDGWYFIQHPLTNQRLKNNGDGTYGMVPAGNTGVDIQWRFIIPLLPDPVAPPDTPSGLAAMATTTSITLTWNPPPGALSHSIRRASSPDGPWDTIATGLESDSWTDEGLPAGTTWFYQVIAANNLGDSPPSAAVSATTPHPFATYDGWVQWFLGELPPEDQAPDADPDNDGKPNLLEFAFLTDPTVPGGNPFRIEGTEAETITLEFPWNWRAGSWQWRLLHGQDLADTASWPAVVPLDVTATRDGDIDLIRVTVPVIHPDRGFFVLKVLGN